MDISRGGIAAKPRIDTYDVMKAFAIFLVIIGHIMNASIEDFSNNILYDIVWSLEMPVFFFVSGVFLNHSGKCDTFRGLLKDIGKKATTYLVPFFSFFLVDLYIFGSYDRNIFAGLSQIVYPYGASTTLWFLLALFLIAVVFDIGIYVSKKIKPILLRMIAFPFLIAVLLLPFLALYRYVDPLFLSAKYIVYYSIFVLAGRLFAIHQSVLKQRIRSCSLLNSITLALMVLAYFFTIIFVPSVYAHLFNLPDDYLGVSVRILSASSGIVILYNLSHWISNNKIGSIFSRIGRLTLEIYYVHILVARFMIFDTKLSLMTLEGLVFIVVVPILVLAISYAIICIIKLSALSDMIIFGKMHKRDGAATIVK